MVTCNTADTALPLSLLWQDAHCLRWDVVAEVWADATQKGHTAQSQYWTLSVSFHCHNSALLCAQMLAVFFLSSLLPVKGWCEGSTEYRRFGASGANPISVHRAFSVAAIRYEDKNRGQKSHDAKMRQAKALRLLSCENIAQRGNFYSQHSYILWTQPVHFHGTNVF